MKNKNKRIDVKVILAFAAIYIIWGTTYLAIKIGLEQMPPFLMASMRYFIAGIVLLSICAFRGHTLIAENSFRNLLLGALMLPLGQAILFWVEQYLSSGLTAVYSATLPLIYVLVDGKNRGAYFKNKVAIGGIVAGLAGIILLFAGQGFSSPGVSAAQTTIASIVVIASCCCWATGTLYYKNHLSKGDLFNHIGFQLLGGAVMCSLIGLLAGESSRFVLAELNWRSWGAVLYLAIAGSVVAFTASYYLLSVRPAAVVGTYAYVNPVIAVLLGCMVANETITLVQVLGMVVILISAYLSNRVKEKAAG